jgi:hypothetical protein
VGCTPVIPATWREEVGGSPSEAFLGKCVRPYLKNKLKPKGLGEWLKWHDTFSARQGPEF